MFPIKLKKALTLMQLMVVIIVLGIITAIAMPNVKDTVVKAKEAALLKDIDSMNKIVAKYYLKNNEYPINNPDNLKDSAGKIDYTKLNNEYLHKKSKFDFSEGGEYYFSVDKEGKVFVNKKEAMLTLDWLKVTDMIADSIADQTALSNGGAAGVPNGLVLWNYDIDTKQFSNGITAKGSMLSVNTALRALLDAYEYTGDITYLNRAEEVGGYIINNIIDGTVYGQNYKFIVTQRSANNNWNPDYAEVYIQDIAMAATNLFRLYEKTNNDTYLTNAENLMDTLNKTQDLVDSGTISQGGSNPDVLSGGFFWLYTHLGGNTFSPTWTIYPLDNVDMIVDAYQKAYEVTNNLDYKRRLDWYSTFVETILTTQGGINANGFLYEFYADRGTGWKAQNWNQLTNTWGEDEPFTTDQFFYGAIGIAKINRSIGEQLYKKATEIQNNYLFNGQYNPDGTPDISELEIINTGLYLELSKIFEKKLNTLKIENVLIESMRNSDTDLLDYNVYGAYEWATNSPDNIIESIATTRIISALIR